MIGIRTATILYVLLLLAAFLLLHGKALVLGLIIICGIAAKSYIGHWRSRSGGPDENG